jgi:hypothetical protein
LTAGFIAGLNIESSDYLMALWAFIAANGLKAIEGEDARLHFLLDDALDRTTQAEQAGQVFRHFNSRRGLFLKLARIRRPNDSAR